MIFTYDQEIFTPENMAKFSEYVNKLIPDKAFFIPKDMNIKKVVVTNNEPNDIVGYCKECGSEVFDKDLIEDEKFEGVYECPKCYHPHSLNELWDEVPYYIKNK